MKEFEPRQTSVDEQAMKEVEGYVERIEKQVEISGDDTLKPSPKTVKPTVVTDDMGKVVMQSAQGQGKQKIVLPMDEEEIKDGLHHKIIDAARWLSEWCIYMIKKYPGRVFYRPSNDK